jgi:hypothetical protein
MLGQNGVSRGRGNALVPLPQEVLNGPTSRRDYGISVAHDSGAKTCGSTVGSTVSR